MEKRSWEVRKREEIYRKNVASGERKNIERKEEKNARKEEK